MGVNNPVDEMLEKLYSTQRDISVARGEAELKFREKALENQRSIDKYEAIKRFGAISDAELEALIEIKTTRAAAPVEDEE